jgi:hypothetical protein
MDLNAYVGKTYQEMEFFALLQFDIEENFDYFSDKNFHFYFERVQGGKIKITELVSFNSPSEIDIKSRSIIEKQEWFEICENENHSDLLLVRLDRTGQVALIWRDKIHVQDWKLGWADEGPPKEPLTEEEIREGIRELCGFFEDQQEVQKSKSKKAV